MAFRMAIEHFSLRFRLVFLGKTLKCLILVQLNMHAGPPLLLEGLLSVLIFFSRIWHRHLSHIPSV